MIYFIIPKFSQLYIDTHAKLPIFTQLVFQLAHLLQYFPLILLAASIMVYSAYRLSYLPHPYTLISQFHFFKTLRILYFTRNLSLSITAGLPLIDALQLSGESLFLVKDKDHLNYLLLQIQDGSPLHAALNHTRFFPDIFIQMIKIGEETGKLDELLTKCAMLFETEIERRITLFNQLLEPLIILILGVLIGGLVIAMYLPIFKLGTLF